MKEGLLWFDNSNKDLRDKVRGAIGRYRHKFGAEPTTCYVNPRSVDTERLDVDGVEVRPKHDVLPHHFWIGVEANESQAKTRTKFLVP